jgi:SLT domain-containing protein
MHDATRMHFHALDRQQQSEAIQRLAATGQGEHTIAYATGLSVEMVRRVLGEHRAHQERAA